MTKTKSIKTLLITFCIALFAFCISLVGATTVFAADGDVNYLYCDANGANWQTGTKAAGEYTPVTSSDTAWGTSDSETWYVASGDIKIGSRVTVNGTVNLILADDANLRINGGIAVNSGNTLIIWGQSGGTGKLTATNYEWDATIGGDSGSSGGVITIGGGNVTASCYFGAGIGGGASGNGSNITISGGTVTASSANGAGIGGGVYGNGGNITISGGTVTAGSSGGAGIGGGAQGSGGTITISGGTVIAGSIDGAGIGGGIEGNGGVIAINGGTVTASAERDGAGIGGGIEGNGGNIIISGGTVTAKGGSNGGADIGGGYEASSNGTLSSGENGSAIVQASNINADTTDFVDYIEKSDANYTVHGNVTLSADLTIPEGETLTVPENATLTVPEGVTLTSNGTLNCNSHSYKNGFCSVCTGYEAAKPVSDTHHPELNETHNGYYAIENAGQLYWFAQEVNGGNNSINGILTANIVVNEKVLDGDGSLVDDTAALRDWKPPIAGFNGIFDGDGHTVSGLYGEDLYGMFNILDEDGTVKNVGIINSYTTYAGIVRLNYGVISGCYVADSLISGDAYAASIVCLNYGILENCWSDATVQTTSVYSGGLVGRNEGSISNCFNLGTISGGTHVGAISGLNEANASVINCYFSSDNFSGDAVGLNEGSVDGLTCGKTAAEFASGEVAYLLNGDGAAITWGQNIGTDAYPVLGGAQVYRVKACDGENDAYSNTNAQKPHTPEEDDGDCMTAVYCAICGVMTTEAKDAHCYTDGCTDIYCDNGICTQTREPGEHDFSGEWQSDADGHWHICSNDGCNVTDTKENHSDDNTDHACDGCGKAAISAHTYGDATCEAPATCSACGATTGEALGHSWNEGVVTTQPTCTAKGVKTYTCTNDNEHTGTEDVVATGHAYDHACETTCNTCGEERTPAEHIDADENNACDECGAELPKDGLSGGVIAGIAVGSVVVAGVGGFSLLWFVIKKKKWADLIAVFKK